MSAPSIILSQSEIFDLTKRERPSAQARVLTGLGIPFKVRDHDGILVVSRAAAEQALGAVIVVAANDERQFDVNVDGAKRGKRAEAR